MTTVSPRVIASATSWIEGEAVRQLERTAALEGVRMAVGLPDLHAGKGHPIGAVFGTEGLIYPFLVGGDIGCGMALFSTDLSARKPKRDRWTTKLRGLDGPWEGDAGAYLAERGLAPSDFDGSLGTIGGGNHFAELQSIDAILDEPVAAALNLDPSRLVLLVHSGSRGLGESILRAHTERFRDGPLALGTPDADDYLRRHDHAMQWARASRALIAERFAECLGAALSPVLDIFHNSVTPRDQLWLHRKGAAPADQGPVVIPGSRGHHSYLVVPQGDVASSGFSLAHGAGRKWTRSDARARLKPRLRPEDLVRTELGSDVICEDRDLLYEEAPDSYKSIDRVLADLQEAGVARPVARLRPLITYKTRGRDGD
jgi:release factor H-coupled RctB family protein